MGMIYLNYIVQEYLNLDLLIEVINSAILIRGPINRPGVYIKNKNDGLKSLLNYAGYKNKDIIVSQIGKLLIFYT